MSALRHALARLVARPPAPGWRRARRRASRLVVADAGSATSARRVANDARARRERIENESKDPRDAAVGHCRACDATHRLTRTPEAESEALALARRVEDAGRLDFDVPAPGDARFDASNLRRPGGGKMLGVLLASAASVHPGADADASTRDDVVVLKAFSGQLFGEWSVPGWAPPLCGLTHAHPRYVRDRDEIKTVVDAAAATKADARALELAAATAARDWDARIDALSRRLKERSRARRATRAAMERSIEAAAAGEEEDAARATLAATTRLHAAESRAGKRELARLKDARATALASPTEALERARSELTALRSTHRALSRELLGAIFESYRLPNFTTEGGFGTRTTDGLDAESCDIDDSGGAGGWTASGARMADVFVRDDHGDGDDGGGARRKPAASFLPCGCGDCAAPKLLAECARRGLTPMAIAEVWVGSPPREEGERVEGTFYGACANRCRPILGHMLCGVEERRRLIDAKRK